jgi:uncharacterized membrane protein
MAVEENIFWIPYLIILLISFIGFIIPFLLKETIIFGSRFPVEIVNRPETNNLKQNYKHVYLSVNIPFVVALGFLLYNFPDERFFSAGFILQLVLIFLVQILFNRKAREVKNTLLRYNETAPQKQVVTVDTKFREGKYLVPIWWFLPAVFIIILNFLILILFYDKAPAQIPLHFDIMGNATEFAGKSYLHVLMIPISSVFMLLIFVGIYFLIKRSKQEIESHDPEISGQKDRRFRLIWSGYLIIMFSVLITWFFFLSLHVNGLLIISGDLFRVINMGIPFLILLSAITLAIKTGQSGSRLKSSRTFSSRDANNADDDQYWKLGMIYYNPDDPSFFVEKRYGIGWTINFGHTAAVVMFFGILAAIIIIEFILKN